MTLTQDDIIFAGVLHRIREQQAKDDLISRRRRVIGWRDLPADLRAVIDAAAAPRTPAAWEIE